MAVHEERQPPGLFWMTIDSPAKRNALSADVIDALARSLNRFAGEDELRVGVLTGAGDVFCAGGDTSAMGEGRPSPLAKRDHLDQGVGRLARLFLRLDKPVIAAVNGPAVGAGMDLALWCDFRMAQSSAWLLPGYIDMCLPPGFGGAWHLTHLVGRSRALEILLTGRRIPAEEALRLGIARSVSPTGDDLTADVTEFAGELAAMPLPAVRVTKRLVQRAASIDALDSLEQAWASFGLLQETPEHVAAVRRRAAGDPARL